MSSSSTRHTRFLRRALLAAWAMFTLILLFSVVLLVNEMMKLGHDPLAVSFNPPPPPADASEAQANQAREVPLFFANADGTALAPETRRVELGDSTLDNCRAVLLELIKGPKKDTLTPIFPSIAAPESGIRALYLLEGGQLVVDLPHEILFDAAHGSTSMEALLAYGVANTLVQPAVKGAPEDAVQSVLFLVDGSSPTERFATHLDLSRPVAPDSRWNSPAADASPNAGPG
jgi:hypothetical protein